MTDHPPHREGREDHEDRLLESIVGPPLVARLYGLLRAVRIYDLSNQVVHVVPITLEELENAQSEHAEANDNPSPAERDRARRMFRQALQGTKAAILRTARTGHPAIRRAKRVVQPIVDSIMKNEFSVVG